MIQNILVVGAKTFDFQAENGDEIKGTQLHYLMTEIPGEGDTSGFVPVKAFLRPASAKNVKGVPGIYEASFGVSMKDGKPTLTLQNLTFVSEVSLG